jgi:predicted ester cyclase
MLMKSTHLDEWLGMKPIGKKLRITGVDIDRLVDGKIVEQNLIAIKQLSSKKK